MQQLVVFAEDKYPPIGRYRWPNRKRYRLESTVIDRVETRTEMDDHVEIAVLRRQL
jgi:hypothetical protein